MKFWQEHLIMKTNRPPLEIRSKKFLFENAYQSLVNFESVRVDYTFLVWDLLSWVTL